MAGLDTEKYNPNPALRVSQLDAAELDNEVISLLKLQLSKLFKYHQTNVLVNYDPEVNAVLKFIVWKFTVAVQESTIGHNILNLKYFSRHGNQTFQLMSRQQKNLYALILIGCPWLRERSSDVLKVLGLNKWREQVQKALRWADTFLKVASLVNFLVFLQQGVYQSISERILGIRPMFQDKQGMRQVSFEYMTRELLWHGFSEFLFFILPFVNFQRMKNFVLRKILPTRKERLIDPSTRPLTKCAICGDWPINPQEFGCQHVYCYFCVKSNYKADPGYSCPLCNMNIPSDDTIQPFKFTIPAS